MPQGNKFGRLGGGWMVESKLRALFEAGLTYDEIAVINERSQGWKPSRSGVKRKLEALGLPARRTPHRDLLPWKIRPEHNDSRLRSMLQAESRARQRVKLSDIDKQRVNRLHELLFGRGKLMVVGYHPEVGFYLTDREDTDEDIIRTPSEAPAMVSPALQEIVDLVETMELPSKDEQEIVSLVRRAEQDQRYHVLGQVR